MTRQLRLLAGLAIAGAFSIVPLQGTPLLLAQAHAYERLQSFSPSQVLSPELVRGPHHTVEGPVTNDGMMNHFRMKTKFGTFTVEGRELLTLRIRELAAAIRLEDVGGAETMLKSAGRTVLGPLSTAKNLITEPGKTVTDTAKGFGKWFGRAGASMSATDPDREGMLASVSGGSSARRQLAYDFGIDPYTTFQPLDQQLHRLASASAVGGSMTSAGLAFVSGGAGIAISVGSTSNTVRSFLRDKTVAELEKFGRENLASIGVSETDIQKFYGNPSLSPTDKALIVESLLRLRGASRRDIAIRHAALASSPSEGFFHRRRAELTAAYHERVSPVRSFVSLADVPMAETQNGLVGIFPVDFILWTQPLDRLISEMNRDRTASPGNRPADFWVTGSASKLAVAELGKRGWRVSQNIGSRLEK